MGAANSFAVSDPKGIAQLRNGFSSDQIDEDYKLLSTGYFLLHAAEVIIERTTPFSGRYKVRVWIESYNDEHLDDIVRVTYRMWDDSRHEIISTASRETNFDLWLSIYGEFPVLACIEKRDETTVSINRYLDLPGRPPD